MRRHIWCASFALGIFALAGSELKAAPVTFHNDVLPILQEHCQTCHRPGNIAPMSFLTYQSTRPWAKAMKAAVLERKMPPWSADPHYSQFSNDPSLKQKDIDTIAEWADSGAPAGDEKDAPPPRQWPENGWTAKPDIILPGVPYTVPAKTKSDVIEWMSLTTPTGFAKDTWVTSVEIKPSELAVTHHICISFVPHRSNTVYNTLIWTDKQRDDAGIEVPPTERKTLLPTADGKGIEPARAREAVTNGGPAIPRGFAVGVGTACYVPGRALSDFRQFQAGVLVPAGYDVSWTLHYTPSGTQLTDRPEIGLTIAKEPPPRLLIESGLNAADARNFAIPPNASNYSPGPAEYTMLVDAELHWMSPHMHLRGKDMMYRLLFPDGREQIVLNVPHYDFNWQLGYDLAQPIKLPQGTKLIIVAHYDNSSNNKFNPDPSRTVYNGNMTWEEMFSPFFAITVDRSVDPAKGVSGPHATGAGGGD